MAINHLAMCDRQQSILTAAETPRSYTPYGGLSTALGARLAYCGELRDGLTGNYHLGNGHRTYSPALMRFHSPDSLSPFGAGGINTYAYCSNDPINYRDPEGRSKSTVTRLLQAFGMGKTAVQLKHIEAAAHMWEASGTKNAADLGDWSTLAGAVVLGALNTVLSAHAMAGGSPMGNSEGLISPYDRYRGYYKPYKMSSLDELQQNLKYNLLQLSLGALSTAADAYASVRLLRFTDEWKPDKVHPSAFEELRVLRTGDDSPV
ncbi:MULTISPECIES: RHS repeat-associated core domain-containing protein [unclassified Pseudomonas]|uniref:RHS repeat-associated core domain-containing protein n=1 Tax=unclassified Pseudomonas TaxID=196821 RepID=UPI002114ED1C|nr:MULTISPECIES: RHS repeat-associated core domain-containing protein [unclassified Pseudomonas]